MASCSSEVRCVSFGHDPSQNECTFSEVNIAESLMSCPDCTYYEKECNATKYVSTASSIITDHTTVTITETSSEHSMSTSTLYPSISSTNNVNTLPTTDSTQKDITSDSTTSSTNNINSLPTTVSTQNDITSDSTASSTNNVNSLPTTVSTQKDITSDSTASPTNNVNTLPTTVFTKKDITSDSKTSSTNNVNTLPTTVSTQKDITSDSTTTVADVSQFDTGTTPNTLSSSYSMDVSTQNDITSESYGISDTTALQTMILETTTSGSTILVTTEPVSPTAEKETTVFGSQSSMPTTRLLTTEADNSNVTSASTEFVNSSIFTVETTTFLNKTAPIIDSTCLCQCFYDNETTLKERMEVRKKYLEVNKRELSSFKRSRVCASDPRYSSTVTGSLGIFVFTFIVLLVVVPDICSTVRHFIRKCKRGHLHVCKLKQKVDKTL